MDSAAKIVHAPGECGHCDELRRDAATIHPWQRPLLDLFDRLRAAGPGARLKLVVGRKRDRLIVVDRDGKEIE